MPRMVPFVEVPYSQMEFKVCYAQRSPDLWIVSRKYPGKCIWVSGQKFVSWQEDYQPIQAQMHSVIRVQLGPGPNSPRSK